MNTANNESGSLANAIVVDASAMVNVLCRFPLAARLEPQLGGLDLLAPELFDIEVVGALAGLERRGEISPARASEAVDDLGTSPVERFSHAALVPVAWSLRQNLSTNDAFYVALARELGCPLLTTDGRLSRAPGLGITVMIVA